MSTLTSFAHVSDALAGQFGPFTMFVLGGSALFAATMGAAVIYLRVRDYLKSDK